jgi:hypothetical protein
MLSKYYIESVPIVIILLNWNLLPLNKHGDVGSFGPNLPPELDVTMEMTGHKTNEAAIAPQPVEFMTISHS